jgi:hypothetical protein
MEHPISLPDRLGHDADQIDDGVRSLSRTADSNIVEHVSRDRLVPRG